MKKYFPILVIGLVVIGGVFFVLKGKKLPGTSGAKVDLDPEKDVAVVYDDGQGGTRKVTESEIYLMGK